VKGCLISLRLLAILVLALAGARSFALPPEDPFTSCVRDEIFVEFKREVAQREIESEAKFSSLNERHARKAFDRTRDQLKRSGVPSRFFGPEHNLAIAEITVDGRPREQIAAFSGPDRIPGTADPVDPNQAHFLVKRPNDSEVKILERLAATLRYDAHGTVVLYSERIPCPSCSLLIHQFKEEFPGIQLRIPRLNGWGH
jgi:hypothetical protein